MAADQGTASGLSSVGPWLSIAGALTGAIGAFYGAQSQQYQLKSTALQEEFAASMSGLNARASELDAQAILRAGQGEAARASLEYAQSKATRKAAFGSRGVEGGVGSTAEELATTELAKQLDVMDINSNAVRAAGAARMRSVDYSNQALLERTSAANLRGAAKQIHPYMSAFTSLLGSAPPVANQWLAPPRGR